MGESDSSFSIVTYIFGCLILNSATAALAVVIGFFLNANDKEYWIYCTIANWLPVLFCLAFGAYGVHYTKAISRKVLIGVLFVVFILAVTIITIICGYGIWMGTALSWKNTVVPYLLNDCIAAAYFYLVDEHISGI